MKPVALAIVLGAASLVPSVGRAAIIPVTIANNQFTPADVTVLPGDTVRWTWASGTHSSTSDTNLWDSGLLNPPATFDFTFNSVGAFRYYCTLHGLPGGMGMSGIIRVAAPTSTPTPTPTPTLTPTPTPTPTPTITPIPTPQNFHSLAPCRVLDTRDAPGPLGGPALIAGAARSFPIAGQCGIPPTAKSVSLNITVTEPTAGGHLTLYPGGKAVPLFSSINYRAGQTRANNAIIKLGPGGNLGVFCGQSAGTAHFLADVNGWFE